MSAVPQPWRSLTAEVKKLQEQVRRLTNASPFAGTGLSIPETGTTQVDGNLHVLGDFIADGKIDNDALVNPIVMAQKRVSANNFSLSTSWSTKATATITVPTGYTQALVTGITGLSANNTSADFDYLFADIAVPAYGGALPGWTIGSGVIEAGEGGISWQSTTVLLDVGSLSSFDVQAAVSTAFNSWSADSGNVLNLDVTVQFTR